MINFRWLSSGSSFFLVGRPQAGRRCRNRTRYVLLAVTPPRLGRAGGRSLLPALATTRRPAGRMLSYARLKVIFCVRGAISPLLANVYLHYALDLWAVRRRRHSRAT